MYLSSNNSIIRAEMDGTNRVPNFIQVNAPRGIFIDLVDPRLYWGSPQDKLIQSSDLDGGDIRTIVQLGADSHPQGLAVMADRIYWTDHYTGKLQSSRKNGTEFQTLYEGADRVMHLVVAPTDNRRGNRINPCDQQCSPISICVLKTISSRCLHRSVESVAYLSRRVLERFPDHENSISVIPGK